MADPYTRGSAPGRRRDADERPGSFKAGHKKMGGRKRGTPNLISADYKKALVEAATRIGSDGTGKDGVVGYLTWAATRHQTFFYTKIYTRLLTLDDDSDQIDLGALIKSAREKLVKMFRDMNYVVDEPEEKQPTPEPFAEAAKAPLTDHLYAGAATREVADLMAFAVAQPKAFCNLYCSVLLPRPKRRRAPMINRPSDPEYE